jgi:hypothetical protein
MPVQGPSPCKELAKLNLLIGSVHNLLQKFSFFSNKLGLPYCNIFTL